MQVAFYLDGEITQVKRVNTLGPLCLWQCFLILASQSGRVTSFVDNQGGVKVVQNLETAVRKNIEIQQVARNSF